MGRLISALALCAVVAGVAAPAASASPGSGPTAVVSMGDSYISGEAGRWAGNSVTPTGDKDGTDRACQPSGQACQVDKSRVYLGGSAENGCHRSDVAEVRSANLPVAERVNIACSGAVTKNLLRASSGGVGQNGEAPEADQLLPIARAKDVKMVVVSIGGNDLGFVSIVQDCLTRYLARQGPCEPAQQPVIDAGAARVTAAVARTLDEIRTVMAQAGYAASDFRLVVQTYPSVIPRASEARYAENDPQRTSQGCPFYDQDLTWARNKAAPQIGAIVAAAALQRGAEVLDLRDALAGHEVCATRDAPSTPFGHVDAANGEWGRFTGGSTVQQGDLQEAFHPDAFAQPSLGACLTSVYAAAPGRFSCAGTPGRAADGMVLTRVGDVVGAPAPLPAGVRGAAPGGAGRTSASACASGDGFRSVRVRPSGRGLRIVVRRAVARRFDVTILQQSTGRQVLGNRLIARFRGRTSSFRWSGRSAKLRDGVLVVRARMRLGGGRADVRRVVVARRDGRFAVRPSYYRCAACGLVESFKLERPVFGGRHNRALGIAFRLTAPARVAVAVQRAGRTVRRYTTTLRAAARTHRLRLASEPLARGTYRIRLTAIPQRGGRAVTTTLTARRL